MNAIHNERTSPMTPTDIALALERLQEQWNKEPYAGVSDAVRKTIKGIVMGKKQCASDLTPIIDRLRSGSEQEISDE